MMLDFTEFRRITEKIILDNFSLCEVQLENLPLKGEPEEYIAVFDKPLDNSDMGMNEVATRFDGILIIQIVTPKGKGTAKSRTIAKELSSIISNNEVENISFGIPQLRTAPSMENHFQQNLIIPYIAFFNQTYS